MSDPDFERRLRASLDARAGRAPSGDGLAELIIAEAVHGATPFDPQRRRATKAWLFPLLAAAAVAAVVLSIVGITTWHPDSAPNPPALSTTGRAPAPSTSPAPTTPPPTTKHTPSPAQSPSTTPTGSTTVGQPLPGGEAVHGFTAEDLTFINSDEGWALGSGECVHGTGRCTAIYRTTDGATWHSVPGETFNVPGVYDCIDPCVSNIRFANASVGYAYGPAALFMTTDGGTTWVQQQPVTSPGSSGGLGANVLETLDGNVIRVVSRYGLSCEAGCDVHVEIAKIGSSDWTTVQLPGGAGTRGEVQLARAGSSAYLLLTSDTVGGGNTAFSTLFVSTDDGATWQRHSGDPCPQVGNREVDAAAIAASPHAVSVLCTPRQQTRESFVAIARNGASTFAATSGRLSAATLLSGDPSTVLVAAGADSERSLDGGKTWLSVPALTGRPGGVSFIGFESETTGRAITDNGRRIWTTSDAGKTWTAFDFPT